jgi:hypothetical protein
MSWQKCALCEGSGIDPTPQTASSIPQCPVCGGQRIIHRVTGQPPRPTIESGPAETELKIQQYGACLKCKYVGEPPCRCLPKGAQ